MNKEQEDERFRWGGIERLCLIDNKAFKCATQQAMPARTERRVQKNKK